jgi:lysophospholipase L1-like esterase
MGLTHFTAVLLVTLLAAKFCVAQDTQSKSVTLDSFENTQGRFTLVASGKWQNPVLSTATSIAATLKANPLLQVDITVPADADANGWLQVKLAIHGEGMDRTESPTWLVDGALPATGIEKTTLSWDTSALSATLPANPAWFKIELVTQGDRARTLVASNLRARAVGSPATAPAAPAAPVTASDVPRSGPTPFPAKDRDWPGKGVIRTFGFMVGERNAFWVQRKNDQGAVVFAGDSLTGGWKSLAHDLPQLKVANRGLGGDVSRGVLWRFQEDVLDLNPKAVVICIGNNDLTAMGAPADMLSNLADTLAIAQKQRPGMPVILCSIPPSANPKAPVKAQDRKAMNEGIQKLATEHSNTYFCDLYTAVADADGSPKPEFFAEDKLHLSGAGHRKWAELLTPIFEQLKLE